MDRLKGVPLDGAAAFAEGYRRNQNPFKTVLARASWRQQYMRAEADAEAARERHGA